MASTQSHSEPIIRTAGLTRRYGRLVALSGLDLDVVRGEVFGYLGPNGAGKTTTIRILLDLIRPTAGAAHLFGQDSRRDGLAIRRRVGYLPGELELYENLTGHQFLTYIASLRGGVEWAYVNRLAERFASDLHPRIRTLSHGNRQKLGLIQAFMHRPELLILDEPTVGLDPLMQQEFYALIAEAKQAGQTVFLSSHVIPEVERTCDRVGILRGGKLITVERISALKEKAIRRVEIRFATAVPPEAFAWLPGTREMQVAGALLRCSVSGSIDPLIKAAARFEVVEINSQEPSLEELFLTYYAPSEAAKAEDAAEQKADAARAPEPTATTQPGSEPSAAAAPEPPTTLDTSAEAGTPAVETPAPAAETPSPAGDAAAEPTHEGDHVVA
jgi:ABC-2 type transport system ATP-binding protein